MENVKLRYRRLIKAEAILARSVIDATDFISFFEVKFVEFNKSCAVSGKQ